jgi:hypothetical protein
MAYRLCLWLIVVSGPGVALGLIGNRVWGDRSLAHRSQAIAHRSQAMNDPWVWGLAFLLGVIVGHYFSTVCPW